MICPVCKKELTFVVDDIWVNNRDYKVKILDFGGESVWVLYLENQNKVAWKIKDFLENYAKEIK